MHEQRSRREALLPDVHRVLGGTLREDAEFATWRTGGTADWLIIYTTAGSGYFGGVDGSITTEKGDVVLLAPGVRHDYGTAPDADVWELTYAHFHPRPDWIPLLDWPQPTPGIGRIRTEGDVQRRVLTPLRRTARMRSSALARAEAFGMNALEEALLWLDTQNPLTAHVDERVLRVIEYIDAHLAEELGVTRLGSVVHLSPSRLTHLFSAHLGVSPQRFVEQQRMRLAEQLLDVTNRSIAAVAHEVGFTDPLYFSQRFRRFAGRSPSAYRRRVEPGD